MLRFTDQIREIAAELAIPRNLIESAIRHPDQTELMEVGGTDPLMWRFYTKRLDHRRPPACLLIETREEGDDATVHHAWPIPGDLVPEDATPLDALRILCDNFGLPITVGSAKGRLLINRRVPWSGEGPEELVGFEGEEGMEVIASQWMMLTDDPPEIHVSLAYAIDVGRLKRAT